MFWVVLGLVVLSVAVLIFLFVLRQTTPNNWWVVEAFRRKIRCVRSVSEPKILIVGGSNVHFGVNAEAIGKIVGIPTLNFGIHAGVSFVVLPHILKTVLRPGDKVILALEYSYYGQLQAARSVPVPITSLTASLCLSLDPMLFFKLSLKEKRTFLSKIEPDELRQRLKGWLHGVVPDVPYEVSGINPWGDETIDYEALLDGAALFDEHMTKARSGEVCLFDMGEGRRRYVRDFVADCRENGIEVFATWPVTVDERPFCAPFIDDVRSRIAGFYEAMGVRMLCDPEEAELSRHLMLDMHYHPTLAGARIRSGRLAQALCRELGREPMSAPDRKETGHLPVPELATP